MNVKVILAAKGGDVVCIEPPRDPRSARCTRRRRP